jgi:hypothetical protein
MVCSKSFAVYSFSATVDDATAIACVDTIRDFSPRGVEASDAK